MTIFPAIDLKDGQCVRLVQGRADRKTVYSDQPEAVARKFAQERCGMVACGRLGWGLYWFFPQFEEH